MCPLNALLRKSKLDQVSPISDDQLTAFTKLVDVVCSPPILILTRPDLPFSVKTDASLYQVGRTFFQTPLKAERENSLGVDHARLMQQRGTTQLQKESA